MLNVSIIKCLSDNYSYLIRDKNTNTIGVTSAANYILGATQQFVYVEDKTVDNDEFTSMGDDVIDFSVTNPFSEGY